MKQITRLVKVFSWGFFSMFLPLTAQGTAKEFNWFDVVPWILAFIAIAFSIYQYLMRRKDKKNETWVQMEAEQEFKEEKNKGTEKDHETQYREKLKKELELISLLGSPDLESSSVKLKDTFVALCISETWKNEERFGPEQKKRPVKMEQARDHHLSPKKVMEKAFRDSNLLLVIGDPGSGKTTLMKYYALQCLDTKNKGWETLGFNEPVFPLYLPLRELDFDDKEEPEPLTKGLEQWAARFYLNIPEEQFYSWLKERKVLLLLDGLDEISNLVRRRNLCRWIHAVRIGFDNANIVVTSRATGYRKLDGVELPPPHMRADILDFSVEQQEKFLHNWFRASFLAGNPPADMGEKVWKELQVREAEKQAKAIINFLKNEENKVVRELASVPMLLEITAVLWKNRQLLPETRTELYEAALNYLLGYRARVKNIEPPVTVEQARRVVAPVALWMQEDIKKDEAKKEEMQAVLKPRLDTLGKGLSPEFFCEYLRDRAGLLADYDKEHYIFRHKSFREFLAGTQLRDSAHQPLRLQKLVEVFTDPWWEETLRFFMCKSDDGIFDEFMRLFFRWPKHEYLEAHQQKLLLQLVRDAQQKRLDALVELLNDPGLADTSRQYVLDCLKTIGTPEAIDAIDGARKETWSETVAARARDIVVGNVAAGPMVITSNIIKQLEDGEDAFRNPFESNVEYIKIPGGNFTFSETEQEESVPDIYVCKYPVTNERYRRFIDYLSGKEKELYKLLPLERFTRLIKDFVAHAGYGGLIGKEFSERLGKGPSDWRKNLCSGLDDDKKFNGAEQPVVGVSWYGARGYCFWLSCLEAAAGNAGLLEDIPRLSGIYRLPTEVEWEWAAGGNRDGTMREYPWGKDKPSSKLANYDKNVGTTTPVGSYPDGATPLGLMDMAGNAWEWMDNYNSNRKEGVALRGGSWLLNDLNLRCSARSGNHPHLRGNYVGFRPFRPSQRF